MNSWDKLSPPNLLPGDGEVYLWRKFYGQSQADDCYARLLAQVQLEQKNIKLFGKSVPQPRLTAWYGDAHASYQYSGLKLAPKPWTESLWNIKQELRRQFELDFNSVLLNYYRNGDDYVAWHRDNERELGLEPVIASLSFGADRIFDLKHGAKIFAPLALTLSHGDLLIMQGKTQHSWWHRIRKKRTLSEARLSLTFRFVN